MEAALVKKYEDALAKDPTSRVFAQLGELYRKLGMFDKAFIVYRDGIKHHPSYILGYLGLAFCYVDLEQYQLAYATLRPLVETSRDNLRLQRLFAECCERLNYKDEALETWKYLLFINSKDPQASAKVAALEAIDSNSIEAIRDTNYKKFEVDKIISTPLDDVDDWIRVDLSLEQESTQKAQPSIHELSVIAQKDKKTEQESAGTEAPLMSLTLVDLYIAQGHQAKAYEVLQKMQELNPSDERIKSRLASMQSVDSDESSNDNEDDGHQRLLKIIEQKQDSFKDDENNVDTDISDKLNRFLNGIKRRAQEKSTQY